MIHQSKLLSDLGIPHGFSTRIGDVATTIDPDLLHQVDQVHGVAIVGDDSTRSTRADGIFTANPGHAVAVRTADCAPVLIAGRSAVAAVHAGWRGATAGIVPLAIEKLVSLGDPADTLVVAIGPTISLAAFEVGPEVIEAATRALGGPPKTLISSKGTTHLDLVDLIERQLRRAGVPAQSIERVGGCTFSDPALYHSYRRDHGTGRHLSAIVFP